MKIVPDVKRRVISVSLGKGLIAMLAEVPSFKDYTKSLVVGVNCSVNICPFL